MSRGLPDGGDEAPARHCYDEDAVRACLGPSDCACSCDACKAADNHPRSCRCERCHDEAEADDRDPYWQPGSGDDA